MITSDKTSVSLRNFSPLWLKLANFNQHSNSVSNVWYSQQSIPQERSTTAAFWEDIFAARENFETDQDVAQLRSMSEKTHVQRMLALLSRMFDDHFLNVNVPQTSIQVGIASTRRGARYP
jgi:hypothetical protein